jgi:hypothetical protein
MDWGHRIRERRTQRRTHALNRSIQVLPLSTRRAMLAAVEAEQLIAGGYTDGLGGACPMLAAHRRGARGYARGFPSAWDRFTGARRPRLATRRELEILQALLQESIRGDSERCQRAAAPATARDRVASG